MTKAIIYLVGLPGTGKTTFRKKWFNDPEKYYIVSYDDEIEKLAYNNDITYNEAWNMYDYNKFVIKTQAVINDLVKTGKNIVIDATNLTPPARRRWLVSKDYIKYIIEFNENSTTREWLARRNNHGYKVIQPHIIEKMRETYRQVENTEASYVFGANNSKIDWNEVTNLIFEKQR